MGDPSVPLRWASTVTHMSVEHDEHELDLILGTSTSACTMPGGSCGWVL